MRDSDKAAIFCPVEGTWVKKAISEFREGKTKVFFGSNCAQLNPGLRAPISRVFFKIKGETRIRYHAISAGLLTENPREYRLSGSEDQSWKYYIGFEKIEALDPPILITDLAYRGTGKSLRTDAPGACIVWDPGVGH